MELIIKTYYNIAGDRTNISDQSKYFNKLKERLEEISNDCEEVHEYNLINWINDYIWEEVDSSTIFNIEDINDVQDTSDMECVNIDELLNYFGYLLKEKPNIILSCCDGQTGNYCSNCGKKLK